MKEAMPVLVALAAVVIAFWFGEVTGVNIGRHEAWQEIRDVRAWSIANGADERTVRGYENVMETLETLENGGKRFADRHKMPPPYQHKDWDEREQR